MKQKSYTLRIIALFALLPVLSSAQVAAEETGHCYSAAIFGTVVLPDGSTHDVSDLEKGVRLRLCYERTLGPVSGLHTIYVDGLPAGRFASYRSSGAFAGKTGKSAYFIFLRGEGGLLTFQGYVARDYDRLVSHDLTGAGRERATSRWELASLESDAPEDPWVLIAAHGR